MSPQIFSLIAKTENYDTAISILKDLFIKPKNKIYVTHKLATRNQLSTETVDEFLQVLKTLSVNCNFQQVSAEEHCKQCTRDEFVQGLCSDLIR